MAGKIGSLGFGHGNFNAGQRRGDEATLLELFLGLRDELDDLRAKNADLLAKMDLDSGVTDTDYAALLTLDAAAFEK